MRETIRGTLSATTIAAALALGGAWPAGAQTATQQQPAAGQAAGAQQQQQQPAFQQAEQSLRQAHEGLAEGGAAPARQQATQQARQALEQLREALGQTPAERRAGEGYRTLERQVTEARQVLQGDRVEPARARTAIEQVVSALPAARAAMGAQAGATGSQVVVQQAAPTLQLTQPPPQVTVQQAEPVITVLVPQPEIIVRQPPAQVTVQMPEPQVAVQQPQPQVRIAEADPQVQVQPGGQAQVQVQRAQPQVRVQHAEGQPQVRFEQQGEPVIRMEQQGAAGAARPDGQQLAGAGATATPAPAQSGGGGAQPAAASAGMPLARVSSLVGTNLVGAGGRDAGTVENLLLDGGGQVRAAVVEWGGFLGIGSRTAAVPIEQIRFGGEGERARMELTREQLERMPRYEAGRVADYGREQGWGEGVRLHR